MIMMGEPQIDINKFYPAVTFSFFQEWNSIRDEKPERYAEMIDDLKMIFSESPATLDTEFQAIHIMGMLARNNELMLKEPNESLSLPSLTEINITRDLWQTLYREDPQTAMHCFRVAQIAMLFGNAIAACNPDVFLWDEIPNVYGVGLVHDVGKIHPSLDGMLTEPINLDRNPPFLRFARNIHAQMGARMIKDAGLPEFYVEVTKLHHTRPDGRAYIGRDEEYMLFAQILRIADSIDSSIRRKCIDANNNIDFEKFTGKLNEIDESIDQGNLFYCNFKRAYELLSWWLQSQSGKGYLTNLFEHTRG